MFLYARFEPVKLNQKFGAPHLQLALHLYSGGGVHYVHFSTVQYTLMATMSLPSMVCMALLFSFSGVGALMLLLKGPALNSVLKLLALSTVLV